LRGKTAVVVDAFPGIGRAPASAGPRRLAPLRARPALGVSVGEQQSHYCDTEQDKTDRAHGSQSVFSSDAAIVADIGPSLSLGFLGSASPGWAEISPRSSTRNLIALKIAAAAFSCALRAAVAVSCSGSG